MEKNFKKKIDNLFDDFIENANDENFIISMEKLLIIEKVLESKNCKDLRKVFRLLKYILRFEYWNKSLNAKIGYLRIIMEK